MFDHSTSVSVHVNDEKGLDCNAYIAHTPAGEFYLVLSIGDVTFFVHDKSVAQNLNAALYSKLSTCLERWAAVSPIHAPTPQPASV